MDKLPSPPEEPQSTPEKHLQDRTPWPNGKVPKNLCVRLQILASKVVISKQVDDYDESLSNDLYECLGQMQDITLTMSLPAFERLKNRVGVVLKPYFLFLDLEKVPKIWLQAIVSNNDLPDPKPKDAHLRRGDTGEPKRVLVKSIINPDRDLGRIQSVLKIAELLCDIFPAKEFEWSEKSQLMIAHGIKAIHTHIQQSQRYRPLRRQVLTVTHIHEYYQDFRSLIESKEKLHKMMSKYGHFRMTYTNGANPISF